jgi:acetyl-CoA carboxylase biotin carboxylase subunit
MPTSRKRDGWDAVPPCRTMPLFEKILIANRGEIAVRVIRTCRDLGIGTVAVYSDADRGALHVRMADEAYRIGPAPSSESYLLIDKILDVAARSGASAIHPGYGFLAENPEFARAVEASGTTFIGPSADSIALMGSKIESRRAVSSHGVPMVPGTTQAIESEEEALRVGREIGYPVMLKASRGGGGKGMRYVASDREMSSALATTRAEAQGAFGDDAVYIEKFLERPRHIEIQVLVDRHGNAIHLGERECTIQRRHQKVIEECPSPIVDSSLRERMGQAALRVVEAASYFNAGTVEFLLDQERNFYFLEMNTRLQVEHPVTEAVTGIDLVREQIRIASGAPLELKQSQVVMRGSAIECRVYAEDPDNNFFPSPGRITDLRVPSGPGIRDDGGVYPGWTVPLDYDPLISKLVAWAPTRPEAIGRMRRAIGEYRIAGIRSNLGFFSEVLEHADFVSGDFDTGFIDRWLADREDGREVGMSVEERDLALIVAAVLHARSSTRQTENRASPPPSQWKRAGRERQLRWRRKP